MVYCNKVVNLVKIDTVESRLCVDMSQILALGPHSPKNDRRRAFLWKSRYLIKINLGLSQVRNKHPLGGST